MRPQEKPVEVSELLKRGSVDGVMGFLAAYQSKVPQLDEQWESCDLEKKALIEKIDVLRKNARDLNSVTVKEAKTNRYVISSCMS